MMRILIVEDDPYKLRNLAATLLEIDGIESGNIRHANDAVEAKRILREHQIDLIVLDLHLPDRIDLTPQPTGGLDFMRSISSRPNFFVPAHVIAVSGNADALAASAGDVGELWGVIRYDATDTQWRDQLRARARYALAALRSSAGRPRETRPCDIAILTALDEELDGVLRLPLAWKRFSPTGDGTIYHEGIIDLQDKSFKVTTVSASRMGMAATAALASKVIDIYRPTYLAMAGISGGIRGRTELGDILIADPSWDWGSGKYEVIDGKPRFAASPEQLRLSPDIRPMLVAASKDEAMLASIRASFPGAKPPNSLACHVEAVASGASVLGDDAVVEEIKNQHRKLYGVEMEIFGLMMAADSCAQPRPIAFSAKSVSDFADPTKSDDARPYAIHASASFIYEFICKYLIRP
ncbi:response regulator [Sphingomonas colocasiae]|uniref:Response regulator n=1 Tax=Sphingomonas colocasiae TaxID=1848973 RepID=A0ABS7PW57_9SPHN|nr:response regulator [Sphingomonas colocasiae]MBY8825184.1 response regulator [Sphingomonas colocasiae]